MATPTRQRRAGWAVWRVRCRACGHVHIAVAPRAVTWPLECDRCGEMAGEAVPTRRTPTASAS